MKILSFLIVLAFSALAFAGPFIVSDPSQECVACFYEADGDTVQYPTEADGSIKHDLETIAPGDHTYQFRYGAVWTADMMEGPAPVDYSEWSVPFHLNRPERPLTSTGHKLSK